MSLLCPRPTFVGCVLAAVLVTAGAASGQQRRGMGGPGGPAPTVIHGGTVHVGDGTVYEPGFVVVGGSEVRAVGEGSPERILGMPGITAVDATGKHVFPGLVHADARWMVDPEIYSGRGRGGLALDVRDALDLFQTNEREEAWSQGITTAYVGPGGTAALDGMGAVIKLKDTHVLADVLLVEEAAATGRLGGGTASVRLREFNALRAQLDAAKKYAEEWEEYDEKYEEYLAELEKLRKERGDDESADEGKAAKGKPKGDDATDKPAPEGEGKGEAGEGESKEGEEGGRRRNRAADASDWLARSMAGEFKSTAPQERRQRGRRPQTGERPPQAEKAEGGDDKKDDDGPKKPKKPNVDPNKEVLRRVLAGELPMRLRINGEADILNALELLQAHPFRMILVGGAEAGKLAEHLETHRIPVVLSHSARPETETPGRAATLDEAGVHVALVTSDVRPSASRFLALSAAAAVAGGMSAEDALVAITSGAAKLLGVDDRVGTLAEGKHADLVLASGPPLGSTTRVEMVWVEGNLVYQR